MSSAAHTRACWSLSPCPASVTLPGCVAGSPPYHPRGLCVSGHAPGTATSFCDRLTLSSEDCSSVTKKPQAAPPSHAKGKLRPRETESGPGAPGRLPRWRAGRPARPPARRSPLCTAMTGRWCWVKLERRGESCGDGLLKGDLSISVFFTGDEMPVWEAQGATGLGTAALLPQPHLLAPLPSKSLWARGRGAHFTDGAN